MSIRLFAAAATVLWFLCAAVTAQAAPHSSISAVQITSSKAAGSFGGVAFLRVQGTIRGLVAADEPVAGLRDVAAGRESVPFETTFNIIYPRNPALADGVIVEASNRGGASLLLGALGAANVNSRASPLAIGAAKQRVGSFLLGQRMSFALIQWQVGEAPGVPKTAQGVGEVIVRDFGRLLAGEFPAVQSGLPVFHHRILAGVSQSAWFVNSFIAEGFNADPRSGRGVYQGVFTRDGSGNVLAINRFADGKPQFPYVQPDDAPLTPSELLTRPKSDPILVDVSALTDFYRVRASVFARAPGNARLYRYVSAAPHAPGNLVPPVYIFGKLGCNGGVVVPMNPISDAFYLRPLLLGLANSIGMITPTPHLLPAELPFVLVPAPPGLQDINRLAGTKLWIPQISAAGVSGGGIPIVEAALPLGLPEPPALPPVGLDSINEVCGDFGGWKPFTPSQLKQLYGSRTAYIQQAEQQAGKLVNSGYLLKQDQTAAVMQVVGQLPVSFP